MDEPVDTAAVTNLKVFVVGREVVEHGVDDKFPVYGPWAIMREATNGEVGGLADDEGM